MTSKIEPDLFARLMKLSSGARNDLFEYIGQTPIEGKSANDLAPPLAANTSAPPSNSDPQ